MAAAASATDAAAFHQVGDQVYVRDAQFAWLPAVVLQVCDDRVLVRIELPDDWSQTTITSISDQNTLNLANQEQWVALKEYYNHCLPLQNNRICRDMAELDHLHEAEILYQIKHRHCVLAKPYTRVGDIIVSVNPCHWIPDLYSTERQQFYMENFANAYLNVGTDLASEEKKDDSDHVGITLTAASSMSFGSSDYDRLGCEPHIYEASSLAFRGLTIDRKKNQAIVVSGESGSGKTEAVKIILKHLASLRLGRPDSSPSLDGVEASSGSSVAGEDDLILHLLASSPIFEAFGNAKTTRNRNSSRFGKVTKLHYAVTNADDTSLAGVSFDTYLLETNRVVSHADQERNFHIFYQLLSASTDVKRELLGPDWGHTIPGDFLYLTASNGTAIEEKQDAKNWNETLKALISFGWDGASLERLMRALGIVLLIGNVVFTETQDNHARVGRPEDLIVLAFALGIPIEEMELALTKRTIQTAQDLLLVPFTPDQAKEACDALAKAIYHGVFSSIVRQINVLTTPPPTFEGARKTISLVDIFGFECFDVNRFEQFCVNFASERLQQKYILDTLKRHTIEYTAEGIALPDWKDIDNSDTVQLLEGHAGLIRTLNEQCIRPNGSSEAFVFIVKNANKKHASLLQDKLQRRTEFGVKHFAGDVIYEASDFLERNADKLPDFLIGVTATSTNDLVAQELRNLMDESNKAAIASKKKANHRSVIDKFSRQLKVLLESIDDSQTRYVRCIKPCDGTGRTRAMDHLTVVNQLKCAGLVTAIELSRDTFPNKLPFVAVEKRFTCLLPSDKQMYIKDMEPHDRAQLILTILFAPCIERYRGSEFAMPFCCGYTKVYFRTGALEALEIDRQALFARLATRIQRWLRMSHYSSRYRLMLQGFTRLQARHKSKPSESKFKQQRVAATRIQASTRSAIYRARFVLMKDCVCDIEQWWLSARARLRYCRVLRAAQRVAAWTRMALARMRYQRTVRAVTIMQATCRSKAERSRFLEKAAGAAAIISWWKAKSRRLRYLKMLTGAVALSALARSRCHRMQYRRMKLAVVLLQARFRSRVSSTRYAETKHAAQIVAYWYKGTQERRKFEDLLRAVAKIADWSRARAHRARFCRTRTAVIVLQASVRARRDLRKYATSKAAATFIANWAKRVQDRKALKRLLGATYIIFTWWRSRVFRVKFVRKLKAATILSSWFRCHKHRNRFIALKSACAIVQRRRHRQLSDRRDSAVGRLQLTERTDEERARSRQEQGLKTKELEQLSPENVHVRRVPKVELSVQSDVPFCGGAEVEGIVVSREVYAQIEQLRKEVDDLSSDLMNVTSEAELHKQEVEAEFEERLAEYEEEVLQLKQTILGHDAEKDVFKAEIAANVKNVQNLKTGIRSMQVAHSDYLGKVTRAIEKATSEHRNAIDAVKQDRDTRVAAMEEEIKRLKKRHRKDRGESSDKRERGIYELARRLEKLVAPDYLSNVAEMASRQPKSMVEYFEGKVSSKARKIIYELEDLSVAPNSRKPEGDSDSVQLLQQQLVEAYEEIELLQSAAHPTPSPKRALRRIFDRM